jgi:hypothetical protein
LGDPTAASELLALAVRESLSDGERLRVLYDASLYSAASGDMREAIATMQTVCDGDWRYGGMAAVDRALDDFPELRDAALDRAALLQSAGEGRRESLSTRYRELLEAMPMDLVFLRAEDPWRRLRGQTSQELERFGQAIVDCTATDEHLAQQRAAYLDEAERRAEAATSLMASLNEEMTVASERSDLALQMLRERIPDGLVDLPADDPWCVMRRQGIALLNDCVRAFAKSGSVSDHETRTEQLAGIQRDLATVVAVSERLHTELPDAEGRNQAARAAFDDILRSRVPARRRGFLGGWRDR